MLNRYFVLFILILSGGASAFESIDFSAVAQGHNNKTNTNCSNGNGNNSKLTINGSARINGTNGDALNFCRSNDGSGLSNNSCDDASGLGRKCSITGVASVGLNLDKNENKFQSAPGNSSSYSCSNSGNLSLGSSSTYQFKNVTLNGSCTLTMSSASNEYRFKTLQLHNSSTATFSAGDYWIDTLSMSGSAKIVVPNGVRLFVNKTLNISNQTKINATKASDFQLVGYNNIQLNTDAEIVGNVYAKSSITINGNAAIIGRVKSHDLILSGSGRVNDPVENIPFDLKYGKADSTSVTFSPAFADGVTPLIFLMPTISSSNPVSDGPASVVVTGVTNSGFTWQQVEPSGNDTSSNSMAEVHWIAVTKGEHTLSDGRKLVAGVVTTNEVQYGGDAEDIGKYVDLSFTGNSFDLILSQLQTRNNNCWLTSIAKASGSSVSVSMDISEVYSGQWWSDKYCEPGDLLTLSNETVAFLATSSGNGDITLNGRDVSYHFDSITDTSSSGSLAQQCGRTSELVDFIGAPVLVAGKMSRRGGDGGWLRRCQLTATDVSMVVDEDTYGDPDRNHTYESYGFMAFEDVAAPPACFTDDFSSGSLTDRWLPQRSGGAYTPSVVNERLRITQNSGNQATSTSYRTPIPAKGERLSIEFDLFAYGGSGADGIAIVLSDSSVPPTPGAFGGPLGYGYKPGQPGFSGGWLGFGFDEYGNFSAEGGSGSKGRRRQSVAIRGAGNGNSGYRYLKGTCANGSTNTGSDCLSPDIDDNQNGLHRYRIIVDSRVDGKSLVSVERKVNGGDFELIIPQFDALNESGQSAVPDSVYISLTGSTGGSTNIHELDNIEVCSSDVEPVIDHFEFDYSSSPLTCKAEEFTIRACTNADCSERYTDTFTATLSPTTMANGGWNNNANVTFENGFASANLRSNTIAPVTVGVDSAVPGLGINPTLCKSGASGLSEGNCTLTFATSGFVFDVPDKLANKPVQNIEISAIKQGEVATQCVPTFASVTKDISFWSDYLRPDGNARPASLPISVNSIDVSLTEALRQAVSLDFNSAGKALLEVNYADAGEMQLNARYTGALGTDDEGLVMNGSDTFVSAPVGLCIKPEQTCLKSNKTECPVFRKTGENFALDIQAKAWQSDTDGDICVGNGNTPNYEQSNIALGSVLVAPKPGAEASVTISSYNHTASVNSKNTVNQSVSEVGVFKFTASPSSNPSESYLGSAFNLPKATSASVGRFIPDAFKLTAHTVTPACGPISDRFTYMDQPFSSSITAEAINHLGARTANYKEGFAKARLGFVAEDNNSGVALTPRVGGLQVNSNWNGTSFELLWNQGQVSATNDIKFARLVNGVADGPFESLVIGAWLDDEEDDAGPHSLLSNPDMNAATTLDCTIGSTCDAKAMTPNLVMRQGRVVAENTYGPETEELRMPVTAQYWNGSAWVASSLDSCSVLVDQSLPEPYANVPALGYNYAGLPTGDQRISRSLGGTGFVNGEFTLLWQALSSSDPLYRGQVTAPIIVDDWLTWYWDWNGISPTLLDNPRASAYFGTYRGHDRVIYWREVN